MNLLTFLGVVSLSFQGAPISDVADVYEEVTGRKVMVYPELSEKLVTVRAYKPLPAQDAAEWIRKSLELEGVAIEEKDGRTYFRQGMAPVPDADAVDSSRYVFRFLPLQDFLQAVGAMGNGSGFTEPPLARAGMGVSEAQRSIEAAVTNPAEFNGGASTGRAASAPAAQLGGLLASLGVRVIPDHAGNAALFYGPRQGREKLEAMAREMDINPEMIEMEVTIAEYTVTDETSVGVDWSQVFTQATEALKVAGTIRGASLVDLAQVRGGSPALFGGEGLTVFGQVNQDYTLVLQALSKLENFRIVQRPKLQTANHKEANIFVGERVPIPGRTTTETASVQTTEYLPVRLEVRVTPHLLAGGKIRLDFKQSKNDITGFSEVGGDILPNISEQGVENIVLSRDNETVFLGGLRTRRTTKTATGIPGLTKVPVLRSLFGSTRRNLETKEILLFVTPRVSKDRSGPVQASGPVTPPPARKRLSLPVKP